MYGSIYKITNIINNKVYIGQTSISPMKRWDDHFSAYKNTANKLYLYNEMRKYGIENFTFQIIETNIELSSLNEREQYYIQLYRSNDASYGMNLTRGGQFSYNSYLTEDIVENVRNLLSDRPYLSIKEIGELTDLDPALVSDINNGDIWRNKSIKYPIRKTNNVPNKLSESDVDSIIILLKGGEPAVAIAKLYNVSNVTISNINNGKIHKRENEDYPIYRAVNSSKLLEMNEIERIINYLRTTSLSYSQIGKLVGRDHHTISHINNGKTYSEQLKALGFSDFPIRPKE